MITTGRISAGGYQILKPYAVAVDQAVFAGFGVVCTVPGSGEKWACAEEQAVLPIPIAANACFQNAVTYLFYLHAVLTLQKRGPNTDQDVCFYKDKKCKCDI